MEHDYQQALRVAADACPGHRAELAALASWLPYALAQCYFGPASLGAYKEKTGGQGPLTAIYVRRGTRLLDLDNLAGGFKGLIDACRYEKIIPADDPEAIDLIFRQKKVPRAEIGTEILIQRF